MEAQASGDGAGQGAESEKKIGSAGGKGELAVGSKCAIVANEKEPFNPHVAESRGYRSKQAGSESEKKAQSYPGTPGTTRRGDEGAVGSEASCGRSEPAKRSERSSSAGVLSRSTEVESQGSRLRQSAPWQREWR